MSFSLWSFVAGFMAFPVLASVIGIAVWRHDRRVMRGVHREGGR